MIKTETVIVTDTDTFGSQLLLKTFDIFTLFFVSATLQSSIGIGKRKLDASFIVVFMSDIARILLYRTVVEFTAMPKVLII